MWCLHHSFGLQNIWSGVQNTVTLKLYIIEILTIVIKWILRQSLAPARFIVLIYMFIQPTRFYIQIHWWVKVHNILAKIFKCFMEIKEQPDKLKIFIDPLFNNKLEATLQQPQWITRAQRQCCSDATNGLHICVISRTPIFLLLRAISHWVLQVLAQDGSLGYCYLSLTALLG